MQHNLRKGANLSIKTILINTEFISFQERNITLTNAIMSKILHFVSPRNHDY